MVIGRPPKKTSSESSSNYISEPNRPIEIRYLATEEIATNYERILKGRWATLTAKGNFTLI